MNKPNQKYYRKVPAEQVEQFMHFRAEHLPKTTLIDGIHWEYLIAGNQSGLPLLFLPGALSTAESAWRTISLLEQKGYRLITPNYPPEMDKMSGLADGVAEILQQERIIGINVVGGSYGGMLAQVFTHRHPDLVTRLVLSHTYPPVARRAKSVEPALRLFRILPLPMVKKMLRDRMTGILPAKPSPELLLIAAQVREAVDTRLTRQAALSTYLRMMDFDRQVYTPIDLSGWPGKILIMLAEDDPTTPENLRHDLIALYPGATVHLFKGSGHATSILESSEYIKVLEDFLNND
ncbi:MAG TPA: alpha/beta hydrolase [Anaerolineales bacterium]|nr:alpha/beta hydrolase [Anaerolineales bacterium]